MHTWDNDFFVFLEVLSTFTWTYWKTSGIARFQSEVFWSIHNRLIYLWTWASCVIWVLKLASYLTFVIRLCAELLLGRKRGSHIAGLTDMNGLIYMGHVGHPPLQWVGCHIVGLLLIRLLILSFLVEAVRRTFPIWHKYITWFNTILSIPFIQ